VSHAHQNRETRQAQVLTWCTDAFGHEEANSLPQRAVRLLEESIEAAQSAGVSRETARRLIDYIFDRPPGELGQEIGGVGLTLLALAEVAEVSADGEERREIDRVLSKSLEHFTARNKTKNDCGFLAAAAPIENATRAQIDAAIQKLHALFKANPGWENAEVDYGICINCARFIQKEIGGRVVGYHTQDNPEAEIGDDGHDFLLVGSFLVDVWAYEYTCGRPLYDLSNRGDEALVRRLYGPREKWQEVKP